MNAVLMVLLALMTLPAQAQVGNPVQPTSTAAERARIDAERTREKQRFEKAEAYCYQRFAVNDCLRDVALERRARLDELRRQEIILNDTDRRLRAGEQLQQLDEKKAASRQPAASAVARDPKPAKEGRVEQEQQEEQRYREKQQRAQERRVRRDQQQADKNGTPSKALPTPP